MCQAVKFAHVHCKICKAIASTSPCGLCIWRGRDQEPKEPELPEEF